MGWQIIPLAKGPGQWQGEWYDLNNPLYGGHPLNIELSGSFADHFAEMGQAKVVEYRLSEKLAASRLLVSRKNFTIMLKTAYDECLANFAPGRLLLKDNIEHVFAEKKAISVGFHMDATPETHFDDRASSYLPYYVFSVSRSGAYA